MPRASPAPSPARQAMRRAYEELQRTISPQDLQACQSTTLEDVQKAARNIETQLAARQSLRNMRRLLPLFAGMEHYAKVMDILCNGTPFLPWIWAPITLILRIASEYIEAFEEIMKGYARIAASLMRFEILDKAFTTNQSFQQSLAAVYDDILQFHQHAYKFVHRSGWKLLFITSWGRFQRRFEHILDDLERHGDLIDKEANALNIVEAQQIRQEIRDWKEKSLESLSNQETEQSGKQYQAIKSWLQYEESDQLAIFDSISNEAEKYPGTCSWFIRHPKVQSWLQQKTDVPILWLQGIPGSGKSSICAQVVNFIIAGNMPVIYYFCSSSYASSVMYEQILRSLLLQLCQSNDIIAYVYSKYVLGKISPKIPTLENLLRDLFKVISHGLRQTEYIWIVLDGFSECQIEKQARITTLIHQITSRLPSSGSIICKALISCQTSTSLSSRLKEHTISLAHEKTHLDNAIRQYASLRLTSLSQRFAQLGLSREEIEQIELGVARKADGMFLYTRLVLDYLATNIFYSSEEIQTSLNQLPERLTDFYQKILTRILIHLDPRSVDRVRCLFGWVAFQKRPLKRLELLSAVTFSPGVPDVTNLAPDYIMDVCGPLLEERQDTTVTFIHSSVKLFLSGLSGNLVINEDTILPEHGIATVACLLSGIHVFNARFDKRDRQYRVLKGLHGFHVYATEYWSDYLLSLVEAANTMDTNSHLITLACTLAQRLDDAEAHSPLESEGKGDELDKRLNCLVGYPVLAKHVGNFLRERSLKTLESQLLASNDVDEDCLPQQHDFVPDGISSMLAVYQETVRHLLDQPDFPGISAEALKFFKTQLGTSAFTCRLKACPRATLGFASERCLSEHELSHLRRFPCTFPGCQYPPTTSAGALQRHEKKHHAPTPPRKMRRKPRLHVPSTQSMDRVLPGIDFAEPMPRDTDLRNQQPPQRSPQQHQQAQKQGYSQAQPQKNDIQAGKTIINTKVVDPSEALEMEQRELAKQQRHELMMQEQRDIRKRHQQRDLMKLMEQRRKAAEQHGTEFWGAQPRNQRDTEQRMMNVGREVEQNPQQGFQHPQDQIQASQNPQQAGNQGSQRTDPNQQMSQISGGQAGPQNGTPSDPSQLTPADQQKVMELAVKLAAACPEPQKNHYRNLVKSRFAQKCQEYEDCAKDPVLIWFQHQAFLGLTKNIALQRQKQQQQQQR